MKTNPTAATYQRNAVLTASPEKLVKLLYDGAIKNLEKSRVGLADQNTARSPEVGQALSRAMGILGELRASLDMAVGGKIADWAGKNDVPKTMAAEFAAGDAWLADHPA